MNEKIQENKRTIILLLLIISLSAGIYKLFLINEDKRNSEITIDSPIKTEIKLDDLSNVIKPFIDKTNIFIIENKTDMKIPFVEYHDKLYIKTKEYNNKQNLQLDISGDIKVNDKQLNQQQLKSIKNIKDLAAKKEEIKELLEIKECKEVPSKNIFVYINKGVSLTFRKNGDFIQFNILDNKIFTWQERNDIENSTKYLLCNYNPANMFDAISDYLQILKTLD
jgi:hypothetical protein